MIVRVNGFVYESLPGRVVFGLGAQAGIADEVARLGAERVLLLSSPSATAAADASHAALGVVALRWTEVAEHVPIELAERARAAAWDHRIDVIVAIGGGSAIGLAKAIALELGAPIVAVPTTYAGSEMTPMYGLTEDHKVTGRDMRVLPRVVVYDPELTLGLPVETSVASAANALAHCVEGGYGPGANPVTTLAAIEGIRVLSSNVPLLARDARDADVRSALLYGAYLAGTVIASVGVGIHHRTCHVLGGSYGLPHAACNAVVLPHALAYNAPAVPELVGRWAEVMGTTTRPHSCSISRATPGCRRASPTSGFPSRRSTMPRRRWWRRRTRTRAPSMWRRCARCSTTPGAGCARRRALRSRASRRGTGR
jgi:alcohol dehydrogenase class IV